MQVTVKQSIGGLYNGAKWPLAGDPPFDLPDHVAAGMIRDGLLEAVEPEPPAAPPALAVEVRPASVVGVEIRPAAPKPAAPAVKGLSI